MAAEFPGSRKGPPGSWQASKLERLPERVPGRVPGKVPGKVPVKFPHLSNIVNASRSPPGLDPKRVHFWSSFSPGSEKNPLLELIFALGELFGVIFGSFFDP